MRRRANVASYRDEVSDQEIVSRKNESVSQGIRHCFNLISPESHLIINLNGNNSRLPIISHDPHLTTIIYILAIDILMVNNSENALGPQVHAGSSLTSAGTWRPAVP